MKGKAWSWSLVATATISLAIGDGAFEAIPSPKRSVAGRRRQVCGAAG